MSDEKKTCGGCKHWRSWAKHIYDNGLLVKVGTCECPLPMALENDVCTYVEHGLDASDCPCFERAEKEGANA